MNTCWCVNPTTITVKTSALGDVGDADVHQALPADLEERHGLGARLRRGLETRDRPLEQQLVANHVLGGKSNAELDELDERLTRILGRRVARHEPDQLAVTVDEHRVV